MVDTGTFLAKATAPTVAAPPVVRRDAGLRTRLRRPVVSALLIMADAVTAGLAVLCVDALGVGAGASHGSFVTLPMVFIVLCCSSGMYFSAGPSPYERFRLRGMASFYAVAIALLISGPPIWVDAVLFAACAMVVLVVMGHYAEAALTAILVRVGLWAAPTVVVGRGEAANRLVCALLARPDIGLAPIGFITVPGDDSKPASTGGARLLPTLGTTAELAEVDAEIAIFTSPQDIAKAVGGRRTNSRLPRLVLAGDIPELGSLWLRPRMLGDAFGMEVGCDYGRRSSQAVKRAIDLALAIPAAVIALPVMALLAFMIVIVSPGRALYSQERVGRNGRMIQILKLRTMYLDAEPRLHDYLNAHPEARAEWDRFFKLKNDPRVLPVVGGIIRRFSLDELPQLWNVIRGDLSLVGPRPFPAYHVQVFDPDFQALRESVPPGLTGIWQISARSNGDITVQKSQDVFYIKNRSIWLDLYIILQTVPAVVRGSGAC